MEVEPKFGKIWNEDALDAQVTAAQERITRDIRRDAVVATFASNRQLHALRHKAQGDAMGTGIEPVEIGPVIPEQVAQYKKLRDQS